MEMANETFKNGIKNFPIVHLRGERGKERGKKARKERKVIESLYTKKADAEWIADIDRKSVV